jgi:hypothetical protein
MLRLAKLRALFFVPTHFSRSKNSHFVLSKCLIYDEDFSSHVTGVRCLREGEFHRAVGERGDGMVKYYGPRLPVPVSRFSASSPLFFQSRRRTPCQPTPHASGQACRVRHAHHQKPESKSSHPHGSHEAVDGSQDVRRDHDGMASWMAASISSTRVNFIRGLPAALPRATSRALRWRQSSYDT